MNGLVLILIAVAIPFGSLAPTGQYNDMIEPPPAKRKKFDGPRCQLTFSEFQFGWSEAIIAPFVELRSLCQKRPGNPPKNALSGYMMIAIQEEPSSLAMVLKFDNFPHDGTKKFIVVGPPNVENVDISLATPHVQSVFSKTDTLRMLPVPNEKAYAFLLLRDLSKSEERMFNLYFSLDGNMEPRRLTTEQIKLIANKAVDMFVLGKHSSTRMDTFEYVWPDKTNTMISAAWEAIIPDIGISLSMCTEDYKGFDSNAFLMQPESPGAENVCPVQVILLEDETTTQKTIEEDAHRRKLLHSISEEKLNIIRSQEFENSWIDKCKTRFPKKSKYLEDDSVQKWIVFDDPQDECRFKCKMCSTYLDAGFRPDIKAKPNIVTKGYLSSDIYDNGNAIKNHLISDLHIESSEFYERLQHSVTYDDVKNILRDFENKEMTTFNATMNIILIVYAEIKSGLSFQTHEHLMAAIRKTGANVGTQQHTDNAPHIISKVLANTFRMKLLRHLIERDQPFSILLDSSTSFNMPFLAVYFQVLEDNYPIMHFYSLIYMEDGEAAPEMSDHFVRQIRRDDELSPGFEIYFKTRLVAFSSDGAAVMVGGKKSFKTHLDKYVDRTIPNVVCMAHKLDSAYKNGIKPSKSIIEELDDDNLIDRIRKWQLSFFETFEQTLNELYTFYSSRGYKKWMHFLRTAEELEIETKRMKYIWNVRWSDSHFRAIEAIHQMLYAILEDLDRLRKDNSFDGISRDKADLHYVRMTDKTYLIVLHEFLDILSSFKSASKKLQESSTTLVGKIHIIYAILQEMEDLQQYGGLAVKDFLQNVACVNLCDEGDCTINMYDACSEVIINGYVLKNHHDVILDYTEVRGSLFNNIIASIKKYFNLELLESFEIFNPLVLNLQSRSRFLDDYYLHDAVNVNRQVFENAEERIKSLCKFYSIGDNRCDQFKLDWVNILSCLSATGGTELENPSDSTRFWPLAMTLCTDAWTHLTKEIIAKVLVTPYSSSEVERGFSVMNSLKTSARSRMDKSTLDALMNVKINGPDIENFNAYEYAIQFLKSYARVDDVTMKGGRKPAPEKLPSAFTKSRIYER